MGTIGKNMSNVRCRVRGNVIVDDPMLGPNAREAAQPPFCMKGRAVGRDQNKLPVRPRPLS